MRRPRRFVPPASSLPLPVLGFLLVAATPLSAQPRVLLELRPVVGDTIRMRIEQETEVNGRRGSAIDAARRVTMTLRLWSRAIVQQRLPGATGVLAVTDSVRLTTSDPHARELARRTERALAGRAMRLHIAPDGTARLVSEAERELTAVVSAMPAALPTRPVAVGDRWRREMPVPATGSLAAEDGVIRAEFRLDSLTRNGTLAWISVRGQLSRDAVTSSSAAGSSMSGTLVGDILLDRNRGWLNDARFSLVVNTTVASPAGRGATPMHVVTRIVQRMRVEGRGARP